MTTSISIVPTCSPAEAFKHIQGMLHPSPALTLTSSAVAPRLVPLLGSGISADAGIPTSGFLCDYITTVSAIARTHGWQDLREYLLKWGWPHRHDICADWLATQNGDYHAITHSFRTMRRHLYAAATQEEIRRCSPLYAKIAAQHYEESVIPKADFTDYRSLLAAATQDDSDLIDAFFDHFIRGREPSTTHQYIAFLSQLIRMDVILTTNFDPLIETALRNEGLNPTVYEVARDGSIPPALLVHNQAVSVVKLHGGTHALRAGYDLDERLPIATLEEIRGYLRGAPESSRREYTLPTMLVMGYSGYDRRVMDVVTDHIRTWTFGDDRPAVIWVSRSGTAPPRLEEAVRSVVYSRLSPSRLNVPQPAVVCKYRNAHLFLQELYQVIQRQHAVTRTSYRVIVSVPRELRFSGDEPTARPNSQETMSSLTQYQVFWAPTHGLGTSRALRDAVYGRFDSTHEIVWIDASDFTTRASLVQQLFDEFVRLDRGHAHVTRPLFLSDVDYLDYIAGQDGQSEEETSELRLAIRWVVHAMQRSTYVLAIDSLGEFAWAHPSVSPLAAEQRHQANQQQLLLSFLGMLCRCSQNFGRSLTMVAFTPMNEKRERSPKVDDEVTPMAASQLSLITGGRPSKFSQCIRPCEVGLPRNGEQQHDLAWKKVSEWLNSDKSDDFDAGIMVLLASIFRRSRSRVELLVGYVRYVRMLRARWEDPPSSFQQFLELRNVAPAEDDEDQDTEWLLGRAEAALDVVESATLGPRQEWQLLSRLEGGFYWMHRQSRDEIFENATSTDYVRYGQKTFSLLPDWLLAQMCDAIATCAMNDVYERSQDIAAFIEYVHYRLLSIKKHYKFEKDHKVVLANSWKDQLDWLVGAIVGECENLLARGRITSLMDEIRGVIAFVVSRGQATSDDEPLFIRRIAMTLFGAYAKLLAVSGHPQHSLAYLVWRAELLCCPDDVAAAFSNKLIRKVSALTRDLSKRALDHVRVVSQKLLPNTKELSDQDVEIAIVLDRIEAAIEIGRILAYPIMVSEPFHKKMQGSCQQGKTAYYNMDRGKRRRIALEILNSCVDLLEDAQSRTAGNSDTVKISQMKSLAVVSKCHIHMSAALSNARFGWLHVFEVTSLKGELGASTAPPGRPKRRDITEFCG